MSGYNLKNSQNFIHDDKLVTLLINKSNIDLKDIVYEIGAGKGIITKGLADSCKRVIAFELDTQLAQNLKQKFKGVQNVEIVSTDFLKYAIKGKEKYKFFSNIPFSITGDILSKVLSLEGVQDIFFILQYEAFLKYAGMPYYNDCLKSLLYKPFFDIEMLHEFVPEDFRPTPKARIVFVHFKPKVKKDILSDNAKAYKDFLAFTFTANGQSIKDKLKKIFSYEQFKRASKDIGFFLNCLVNELSYQQWLSLFKIYIKYISNEKKVIVNDAYDRLLNEQSKLNKVHRNRNRSNKSFNGKRKFN